ncbi:MAG: PE-PPE domain-containing protein [Mycobacterium sp.]|uniref:PE-PPE domain-containing protein n=1 Tax=Mycobacterium sp. TaxID=1785 RepID=UPI003F9DB40E
MNFAVLPPETNSALMVAGAGQGPLLAAAVAWDGLAEEFHTAAGSFASVTSELADKAWQGPAALAMTRVAGPYVTWLSAAAGRAEQAAAQARLAASAFEAALAATVHPIVVAANRTRLVSLVESNLLGQNAPAIAATEAEYEQIWAQDVAAMSGYHVGVSEAVARLTPWQELLQNLRVQLGSAYAASGLPAIGLDLNAGTFSVGNGNVGVDNIGNGNIGNGNIGVGNSGNGNIGIDNVGNWNIGIGNTGNRLIGFGIPGNGNVGVLLINENQVGGGSPTETALIMSGTGLSPLPTRVEITTAEEFITLTYSTYTAQFVVTPEKLFPLTGLNSLTFDASVAQGVTNLNAAIMAQHAAGNPTVVFGVSQSATVATLEMRYLETLPAGLRPGPDQLSFVLIGNPDRPDGGFLARIPGVSIPFLGFTTFGATPTNAYPTIDYAVQYDGAADFPQYPIDIFADANAIAGLFFVHPAYDALTPTQIASGVVEPVSPGDTETTYILIPTQNLPLLDPLRAIPLVGNPMADLVQQDLRVLVELGYDRTAYQDVPTPFGLFPNIDPATVAAELQQGAVQGVNNALADVFPGLP